MAIGDIITAARYNNLQSRVATIMGTGSGDDGYGQSLNSSQVGASDVINATHMSTLYTDIANGRVHQTGTAPSQIAVISSTDTIGGKSIGCLIINGKLKTVSIIIAV